MNLLNHLRNSCRTLLFTSACLLIHAAPALAATATQVSPANGAAGLSVKVKLDWKNLVGADGGDYEVLQGNTVVAGYGITYSGGPYRRTSETLSLDYGKKYKWRVRSRVLPQNNPWSDYWTFSTEPVPVPLLVAPPNGATDLARTVTLDWSAVSGSDGYDFEVQDGQNSTIAGYGINYTGLYRSTSVTLTLEYGTTYRWRTRPSILPQNNPWSEWGTFSIATAPTEPQGGTNGGQSGTTNGGQSGTTNGGQSGTTNGGQSGNPPVNTVPAPTELKIIYGGTSYILSWKNPPGTVRAVKLYRSIDSAGYTLVATLPPGTEKTPLVAVDEPADEVSYKVRAQVGEILSDFSEPRSANDSEDEPETAAARTAAARLERAPDSPGRFISPTWGNFAGKSFGAKQNIVGAYYFYGYDSVTGQHLAANRPNVPYLVDSLTDHPAYTLKYTSADHRAPDHYFLTRTPATYNETSALFSYRDARWHRREFQQMMTGGIDFALADYWGNGDPTNPRTMWSNEGVERMNDVLEKAPIVKLGLFFDTTTLRGVDLSTQAGVDQFYFTIRDFYSRVNPTHWARIDGKAVVWLYRTAEIVNINPQVLAMAREAFARDFGGTRLHVVAMQEWKDKVSGQIDRLYRWGASEMPQGIRAPGGPLDVVDIGPGHNFRGGEHWQDGTIVASPQAVNPRRNGNLYRNACARALQLNKPVVMIETWNEYHEGSEIAGTREYGSLYLKLTRDFAKAHKSR